MADDWLFDLSLEDFTPELFCAFSESRSWGVLFTSGFDGDEFWSLCDETSSSRIESLSGFDAEPALCAALRRDVENDEYRVGAF